MLKKLFIVIPVLLFSFTLVQCQESISDEDITKELVTEEMVLEQKKMCLDTYEIERIERDVKSYTDTTSIADIKKLVKDNYKYVLNNKSEFIDHYENYEKSLENDFQSKTKYYLAEDEEFEDSKNTYAELVNDNHLHYRDTVQSGVYFDQVLENNTSSLETRVRNNGATVFKFSNEETIQPYYSLNFDSEKELKIMNIYYHDGTVDSRETSIPDYSFPLNSIPVDKMKHIDSLQMEFKVMYVSEIDSVHFDKSEIGVKKGEFKLLKMENNYVAYETPNDYYPYHKGSILEENYYNVEGKVLDNIYSHGNMPVLSFEERYKQRLNVTKEYYEYVTIAQTKEQIMNAFQYVQLKAHNKYLIETRKEIVVLKGNVESFTIYQERRRDTITFLTTLKNANSLKNLYLQELEDKTEFIDKNGEKITSLPFSIRFVSSFSSKLYSDKYFYSDDYRDKVYYYLDQEEEVILELPYSDIQFLCKSIMLAWNENTEGFKLISAEENKLLSQELFRTSSTRYEDNAIVVYNDEGRYLLLDQNNEPITSNTQIVTKLTLEKLYDY